MKDIQNIKEQLDFHYFHGIQKKCSNCRGFSNQKLYDITIKKDNKMITKQKLEKAVERGELTSEFNLKYLIEDAIIDEEYHETVYIYLYDLIGDTVRIKQKISDYLTLDEYKDVISLNNGM